MSKGVETACPACAGSATEGPLTVERAPVSCAQLFSTREAAIAAGQCRIEILLCASCGHLWNSAHEESSTSIYNEDYYSSFASSDQGRKYQQHLAGVLDRLIDLEGQSVVEIGCGDGFFLETLSKLGATAIGFEPSSTFEIALKQNGIQVFNEEFQFDGRGREIGPVDIVVMRHVLEHMATPVKILNSLRCRSFQVKAPKYLILEVPNALQLLKDNLYFDFYNDHVHYFSHSSICCLLESTGWVPMASIGSSDEFIRLICVNTAYPAESGPTNDVELPSQDPGPIKSNVQKFRENFATWKEDLTGIIAAQRKAGRSIAVWGAGARGTALLCGLGLDNDSLAYVVDSDSNKNGKYLPVIHLEVSSVDRLRRETPDCVLITSYTYFDEIMGQLEWYRSSGGKVIRVYPEPALI